MTTPTRALLSLAVVGAIFGTLAFFNVTPFRTIVQNVITAGASPQGATVTSAGLYTVAGVNLAAPGPSATSSSIFNNTGQDLYVDSVKVGCEGIGSSNTAYSGAGLASLKVQAATTSTSNPVSLVNTNLVGGAAFVIATSAVQYTLSSSTAAAVGTGSATGNSSMVNIWPNQTYLTFTTNATNTAVCTFGVGVFQS